MRFTAVLALLAAPAAHGLSLGPFNRNQAPRRFKGVRAPQHGAKSPTPTLGRGLRAAGRRRRLNAASVAEPMSTMVEVEVDGEQCDISQPTECSTDMPEFINKLNELQEAGLGSVFLLAATAISLTLANNPATAGAWLSFLSTPVGPMMAGHALSPKLWVNEGLMSIFFFVVGLEIKQELRLGSLSSVRKALLPCIAAVGGMVTPMLVYLATLGVMGGGSLAALTVPMATDIAFAMAIFGFFRSKMPASSAVFLLTLATVDDLGAIFVLATCFAHNLAPSFLGIGALITAGMAVAGRQGSTDIRVFAGGGFALWWCLLRAGVSADVAGVIVALCVSTQAVFGENDENLNERLITKLAPLATFFIMPTFALCNTAVPLGGIMAAGAGAAARHATVAPAFGVGAGLLIGKPIGIYGSTWLATKLGIAEMPPGMTRRHLLVVSLLGAIGFTMCLLLTEVSMPAKLTPIPKLAVLISSAIASLSGAAVMAWGCKTVPQRVEALAARTAALSQNMAAYKDKPALQ